MNILISCCVFFFVVADIATVIKFSHLKEIVNPKVRALIDGHSFNMEGYYRAKTILKAKLTKPIEETNTYSIYHAITTNSHRLARMGRLVICRDIKKMER